MKQFPQQLTKNGFSLPELLVSSAILMMVVAGTAQSQINSVINSVNAGEQNAVQAKITKDLDDLRTKAFRWQCTQESSCGGDLAYEHVPMHYNTSSEEMISACKNSTVGETLLEEEKDHFPRVSILEWDAAAPHEVKKVEIERTIQESEQNKNEILVTYSTIGSSRDLITTTSIIPQAANWCS